MQSFSESQWDAFAFLSQDQTRSTADLPMRLFAAGAPNGQVVVLGGAEGGALHRVQTEAARRRPHAKTDGNGPSSTSALTRIIMMHMPAP
jgi:hypothetical protein